jgi:hypothetical protein
MKKALLGLVAVAGAAGLVMVASMSMSSCGGGSGTDADAAIVVSTGTYHHYITDTIDVSNPDQNALDLDGDRRPDNVLGSILNTIAAFGGPSGGINIQKTVTDAVDNGQIVILHSMRADDVVRDNSVSWRILLANPFTDIGSFQDAGMETLLGNTPPPMDSTVLGGITGGTFNGGPDTLTIELSLSTTGDPIRLVLHGAKIRTDIDANGPNTGCTQGIIGGGVLFTDLTTTVFPAIAKQLSAQLKAHGCDHAPPNACTSSDQNILMLFDHGFAGTGCGSVGSYQDAAPLGNAICGNGLVESDELSNSTTITSLLKPDLDLLDANGNPGQDGHRESVSIGIGFTCRPATFTVPGEM